MRVSEQPGRYQRSFSGMIGAMLVLLVVIGVWVAFRNLTSNEPSSPVQTVAYKQTEQFARQHASFHLVGPSRLPSGWRATTVGYTPAPREHWHLGVLTNHNRYVGLEQGPTSVKQMVRVYVDRHAAQGHPVEAAGTTWQTWTDQGGDLALVRSAGSTTTLVVGHDVPEHELARYVGTLH